MYNDLICEADKLLKTFTIRYNFGDYGKDLYSSTYDELSGWIRKALKTIEEREASGRDSELYLEIKKFRGRSGDMTLSEMKHVVALLGGKVS
jgi:hypothetical protein